MHTFCKIIHKYTSDTQELYNFPTEQKDIRFEFSAVAWSKEYKPNTQISVEKDIALRIIKIFFHMYAVGHIEHSIQSKFSYFKKTVDNIFMNEQTRQEFIQTFCKIQRVYWVINKLVRNYKWRKAPYRIKTDLILNPIRETQHNVITIMHNNSKYLFTILDLKNIIENSLTNSPHVFSVPLPPKNPYNNIPFDKSTLYNIYFFMKRGDFVLSNLFHNYFLCNFSLKQFRKENEVIIRKRHIQGQVMKTDYHELYYDILDMLNTNKHTKRMIIDPDFPMKKLVDIMRPYLHIYYTYLFSLNISERHSSLHELNEKLRRFCAFNPKFGRKYVRLGKGGPNIVEFNDDCVEFSSKKFVANYANSHIALDNDRDEIEVIHNTINYDVVVNNVPLNRINNFLFDSISDEMDNTNASEDAAEDSDEEDDEEDDDTEGTIETE
jgi:hypothetical protein